MKKLKTYRYMAVVLMGLLMTVFIAACDVDTGPDTAGVHGSYGHGDPKTADITGYTCQDCHMDQLRPELNPLLIGGRGADGKHEAHNEMVQIGCQRCHMGYENTDTHLNILFDADDATVGIVNFDSMNPSAQWINDTGAATGQCSSTECHGQDEPYWYGTAPAAFQCEACHLLPEAASLNPLLIAGSGDKGKHIIHCETRGLGCEKCHKDYYDEPTHNNGTMDAVNPLVNSVFFGPTNPGGVWNTDVGPATGQCASTDCHNPDTLNWYDMSTWTPPTCASCHEASIGIRKPVMGAIGNFAENPAMVTFHVVNTVDPADAQCIICHEQTNHMSGAIRLNNADTGEVVLMDESALSTAEPFCLSCHDEDGASALGLSNSMMPFEDGNTIGLIPYEMSAEIKSRWNRANGHRREGLTCLGTGEPNTGCHEGGHGSEFAGLLTKNLTLPANKGPFTNAPDNNHEPDFALCFECHESYPAVTKEVILGVKEGSVYDNRAYWGAYPPYKLASTQTKFLDRGFQGTTLRYDNGGFLSSGNENLHFLHVEEYYAGWLYRGVIAGDGAATCISCHDMHGNDSEWGFLYDELEYEHYQGINNDQYGQMGIAGADLKNFPVGCSGWSCHLVMDNIWGGSAAWFAPVLE